MGSPFELVPPPDASAEPEGFVVSLGPDRIHFLDWGGPPGETDAGGRGETADAEPSSRDSVPGAVVLIHGLGGTSWGWAPVARRLRRRVPTVALDLRGHGLSDAPTSGYDAEQLVDDVVAVAEGSGLLPLPGRPDPPHGSIVLAGHGLGAMVAAWTAATLGDRCGRLVLVDGGWEDLRETTGMEPEGWLRGLDEPPEVLRSMDAFLADRAAFDPATWDPDQERAARATVAEVPAGHLLPAVRSHVRAALVETMFGYRPSEVLPAVEAPIVALAARDDEGQPRTRMLAETQAALRRSGRPPMSVVAFPDVGHNLMRYRPAEVAAAILGLRQPGSDRPEA